MQRRTGRRFPKSAFTQQRGRWRNFFLYSVWCPIPLGLQSSHRFTHVLHVSLRNYQLVLEKHHFNRSALVSVTPTGFSYSSAASGRRLNNFCFNLKLPLYAKAERVEANIDLRLFGMKVDQQWKYHGDFFPRYVLTTLDTSKCSFNWLILSCFNWLISACSTVRWSSWLRWSSLIITNYVCEYD